MKSQLPFAYCVLITLTLALFNQTLFTTRDLAYPMISIAYIAIVWIFYVTRRMSSGIVILTILANTVLTLPEVVRAGSILKDAGVSDIYGFGRFLYLIRVFVEIALAFILLIFGFTVFLKLRARHVVK